MPYRLELKRELLSFILGQDAVKMRSIWSKPMHSWMQHIYKFHMDVQGANV